MVGSAWLGAFPEKDFLKKTFAATASSATFSVSSICAYRKISWCGFMHSSAVETLAEHRLILAFVLVKVRTSAMLYGLRSGNPLRTPFP